MIRFSIDRVTIEGERRLATVPMDVFVLMMQLTWNVERLLEKQDQSSVIRLRAIIQQLRRELDGNSRKGQGHSPARELVAASPMDEEEPQSRRAP